MIVIGLTGSIGMGKSTIAGMFAEHGVATIDSDHIVHKLYAGEAAREIEAAFPGTTAADGVDRAKLGQAVLGDPQALKRLEAIVHPLVRQKQEAFLTHCRTDGRTIALLDIPLLFETGAGQALCDVTVVVSAPADMQRARVLARPGMTTEKLDHILSRQMPDSQKRTRAHFIVDTGGTLEEARAQVAGLVRALASMQGH